MSAQGGTENLSAFASSDASTSTLVTVTPYPDGPLLMRGAVELRTADGERIETTRNTVALCRCGLSNIKPFCDGTHKLAAFKTED